MPIRSSKPWAALGVLLLAGLGGAAWAHTEPQAAIPEEPGLKAGVAAVWSDYRGADVPLPSQALRGYLLQGDAGIERRGSQLEHGVLQAGYRLNATWGGQLAVGFHQKDPAHLEAAWLQARGTAGATDWSLGAGRQRPSMGPVMTRAGHLDRFGLMPLARQAVTNGDWIDDGAEWSVRHGWGGLEARVDAGLWRARSFPGAAGSRVAPALHAGLQWDQPAGDWSVDGFVAQLHPSARATRVYSATGAHTHNAPVCDAALSGVLCLDGRSRIGGFSVQWEGRAWPVTVSYAGMWRDEDGSLQSRNGLAQYSGRTRGDWTQVLWRVHPQWEIAARYERLHARQGLSGAGASLLAAEAGFNLYQPVRRSTAMAGYRLGDWGMAYLEAGDERAGNTRVHFVGLRLLLQWDRKGFRAAP